MRGTHSRCRLAVFRFFAVDPCARVEYTPSLHLLLTIMHRSKETTARVCAYRCSAHLPRSLPRIFLLRKWRLWLHGVPACMQTSIRASEGCPVVCLPMTSGLGCQLPGSQRFRSTAPRFLRFRCDCPRNDLSMGLDSTQLSLFINRLLSTR